MTHAASPMLLQIHRILAAIPGLAIGLAMASILSLSFGPLANSASAADEVLTLRDGRKLVGDYNEDTSVLTMRDSALRIKAEDIAHRRPASPADLAGQIPKTKDEQMAERLRLLKSVLTTEQTKLAAMEKAQNRIPGAASRPQGDIAKQKDKVIELQDQVKEIEIQVKSVVDAAADAQRKIDAAKQSKANTLDKARLAALKWKASNGFTFDFTQLSAEEIEAQAMAMINKQEEDLIEAERERQTKLKVVEDRHTMEENRRLADAQAIKQRIEDRKKKQQETREERDQKAIVTNLLITGIMAILCLFPIIAAIVRRHPRTGAISGSAIGALILLAGGWFSGIPLIQGAGSILGISLNALVCIWTFAPHLLADQGPMSQGD